MKLFSQVSKHPRCVIFKLEIIFYTRCQFVTRTIKGKLHFGELILTHQTQVYVLQ